MIYGQYGECPIGLCDVVFDVSTVIVHTCDVRAMPGVSPSERIVAAYFQSLRLTPERFAKPETRKSKTPDFRVLRSEALVFFCEVKNAQKDHWLDEQGKDAEPGTLYGGPRHDPIYNR